MSIIYLTLTTNARGWGSFTYRMDTDCPSDYDFVYPSESFWVCPGTWEDES